MAAVKKEKDYEEAALLASSGILGQLALQLDNFKAIRGFIRENSISPGTLLLPQTLALYDAELTRNSTFVYECLSFLDIVRLLSVAEYGDPDSFIAQIVNGIIRNRIVTDFELTLGKSTTTNLIFNSEDDVLSLLSSNKLLVSVHLYSVISTLFYK